LADVACRETRWYRDGLRFECSHCGNCCSGEPGYVFATLAEIDEIAAHLGREKDGLGDEHIRRIGRRFSLTEDKTTGDCCFLHRTRDGRRVCGIYPVRPLQCRTWPFWPLNLESRKAWAEAADECPGIGKGPLLDDAHIETRRSAECWEDL
jgi:Fe-S-cluster containining protein